MTELTMVMMTLSLVKSKMLQSMKRIISNVMLIAAVATAFFSCQKQESLAPEKTQDVVLTFSSEKPSFTDETKTEWTGTTVQWSAGDRISIAYTVDGVWMGFEKTEEDQTVVRSNPKLYKSDSLTEAAEVAKFNVSNSFNIADEGAHVFYGVYPAPSATSFDDAPLASLSVPSLQTPNASSFDGAADLMTGVSVDAFNSIAEAKAENISMKWTRLVAHANITLKALKDVTAGERVSIITLTAQDGANLVGNQKVNILTNEVTNDDDASNVLELNGGNLSIDSDGNVEFWACVLPETLTSLTVVVETDKATYTREITGISKTFKQNARNTLSVKMDGATRVAKEAESWVLVTPADGLSEGTYALVASTSTKTGSIVSSKGTSAAPTFDTSVSVEGDILYGVTPAMQFDLAGTAGNWVLYVSGDSTKWLYCNNSNNGVRVGNSENKTWTITSHEENSKAFVVKHNTTNRFLGVYNNQDWRCYDALSKLDGVVGNTGAIFLYKKVSGSVAPDTTPKIEVTSAVEQSIGAEGGDLEFEYTVANSDSEIEATVTQGTDFLESVEVDNGIIAVTVAENETANERVAKITLTCGDATPVVLTITQAGKVVVDDSFESGLYWIMATEDGTTKVMTPLGETANYGYGQTTTVTDGRSYLRNAFTFTAVEGGFTIQDVLGRYYYADDEHQSFQLGTNSSTDGLVWTISVNNDGTYVLTNVGSSRVMKYGDGTFTTFGVYKDSDEETGVYPTLVKADNPLPVELSSISVNGHKTSFTEGDSFEFGGTVTATYTDGSTKDVTDAVSYTTPDMVDGAKVVVSYTEGIITKTFEYTISVKGAGAEVELVTETISGTFTYDSASKTLSLTTASGITVTQTIASGSTAIGQSYNTATTLRVYKGHALTFTGKTITKIELTHESSRAGNSVTASSGTYTPGTTSSIWEGESNNIVITNTGATENVQLRPTKIVVTYQK